MIDRRSAKTAKRAPQAKTRRGLLAHCAIAAAVLPPLLLTARGKVASDSKQLLFLDPDRFLARVPSLWDPNIGAGTVTHQNIGYLLPMGPFFWVTHHLHIPMWVAQRLWLAAILFLAGAGVLFLARVLGWRGVGPVVAALGYAWSPYALQYASHLSVLLLPFAALPWLVGLAIRSVREDGWRWPACFALVVALSGSVNATALVCVLVGPLLALVVEGFRSAAARRRVVVAALRIGLLSLLVSMWWIVGLAIEAGYGLRVLNFTETLETTTVASTAPELLRGLGYWFFYGRDALDPYLRASVTLTQPVALAFSFIPPLLAAAAAVLVRWRSRALFLTLLIVGLVVAVGAFPYDDSSLFGRLFKALVEDTGPGQALRSITRIAPLIALAIAAFIGAGVTALTASSARLGRTAAVGAVVALAAAQTPLWEGNYISDTRVRPESVPAYWKQATKALDARGNATRVLEVPGNDFGSYTWGYTLDSITSGLMDRPTLAREVVPYGTEGTVDLLTAFDGRIQSGVLDARSLPTIARLLGVGDILVRSDLRNERYGNPGAAAVWRVLTPLPAGLGPTRAFGPKTSNGGKPALSVLAVKDPRPIVRAVTAPGPLIVAGSGDGLVDAATAGLLPEDRLVVYSATLASHPGAERQLLANGAELLITDSNRRRAGRFKTLRGNYGFTERSGEQPLEKDPSDVRINLFPGTGDDARTVTVVHGPVARASAYGNALSLDASERPQLALDGDPSTAWRVGDRSGAVIGQRLEVRLTKPTTADRVTLLQAPGDTRWITAVRLTFDGGHSIDVSLGGESRKAPGQVIRFSKRRVRTLGIEVLDTQDAPGARDLSGVGFAEVAIGGVRPAEELLRLPRDLLGRLGTDADRFPLTILMSRPRAADAGEGRIARVLDLPTSRTFTLTGTARPVEGAGAPGAGAFASCRTDLLTVDRKPVPLAVGPTATTNAADAGLPVATCDGKPLVLGRGSHVLRGSDGRATGIDLDQLVLRSAPVGATSSTTTSAGSAAHVRVVERGRTHLRIAVDGARAPFWLVLGESYNKGWRATVRDSVQLPPPLLVNGYANAWYVRPDRSAFTIDLRWQPQRWVLPALAVSAVSIALCLVLALRRRGMLATAAASIDAEQPGLHADVPPSTLPSGRTAVLAIVAVSAVGFVIAGLVPGLVLGVAMLAGLRLARGPLVVGCGALLALSGSFLAIVGRQWQRGYEVDFAWPSIFHEVHTVALVGILLLGVVAVARHLRSRAAPTSTAAGRPE